jgi:preprotein translocase subunit SecE
MVSNVETENPKLDKLLWILISILLIAGIAGNYYYADRSLLLRTVGLLALIGISTAIASRTVWGQKVWQLWLGSIQEVRKIYWPSKQETIHTTLAVVAMVIVVGILLWTADFALIHAVGWLTGHWGA